MENTPLAAAPIAVFDSGLGGLTIVNALRERLPHERIVYFGDTAHLPYGDKSPEVLARYVGQITRFLRSRQPKAIVVACNTASAVALPAVLAEAGEVPVFEVIQPAVQAAVSVSRWRRIGVIGTQTTIASHVYLQQILRHLPDAWVQEKATPLLVPLLEEGWLDHTLCGQVIEAYMSDTAFAHIDTLILGCTHYPLIAPQIAAYFARKNQEVAIVSSSSTTADRVAQSLAEAQLLAPAPAELPDAYFVSDFTPHFQTMAERFCNRKLELVRISLDETA